MATLVITNTGRGDQSQTQYGDAEYGSAEYGGNVLDFSDDGRIIITNNE